MTNDLPIHLGIDSLKLNTDVFQTHLDGLCALIHYCEGVEKSGKGRVPGSFELVMHYRSLISALAELRNTKKPDLTLTEKYEHHGVNVSVFSHLKGKHCDHCLCYNSCKFFHPGSENNCHIAQANYEFCKKYGTTAPIFECPKYEKAPDDGT